MDLLRRHSFKPDLKFTHQQLLGWLPDYCFFFFLVFTSRSWQFVLQILPNILTILLVQSRHVFFMFSRMKLFKWSSHIYLLFRDKKWRETRFCAKTLKAINPSCLQLVVTNALAMNPCKIKKHEKKSKWYEK